jgi:trehalose utilization protein
MMIEFDKPRGVGRRSFLRRGAAAGVSLLGAMTGRRAPAGPGDGRPEGRAVRVLVWCEGTAPRAVYPHDIDGAIAAHLGKQEALSVRRARLSDRDAGLGDEALDAADVLIWWGHLRHDDVPSARADAVVRRVRAGRLGLVALHSSCGSRPFHRLMGMACEPGGWREDGRPEHVHVNAPDHPIARGVRPFTIPRNDMFSEPFRVPEPETVVLVSSWDQGETVRSGLTWTVDKGRVVYLRTGHATFPVLFHPSVRRLLVNASLWAGGRA